MTYNKIFTYETESFSATITQIGRKYYLSINPKNEMGYYYRKILLAKNTIDYIKAFIKSNNLENIITKLDNETEQYFSFY